MLFFHKNNLIYDMGVGSIIEARFQNPTVICTIHRWQFYQELKAHRSIIPLQLKITLLWPHQYSDQ